MHSNPAIGRSGGQHYNVVRAIKNTLEHMSEGGISVGSAVIKELLQNADDAGASEMHVILDERTHQGGLLPEYQCLLGPSLLIRNNAPFKTPADVLPGELDDFTAICDVASGHKRLQATAAGRFGIGFNSVYFVTDTPVLFSRREIHIFDLLHHIYEAEEINGWRFLLDDFPAAAENAVGPVKTVLERILPKASLGSDLPMGELAATPDHNYRQTIFRLPLRQDKREGSHSLYPNSYPATVDRMNLLREMAAQTARAVLFLKTVEKVHFGLLRDREVEPFALVEADANPPDFKKFTSAVRAAAQRLEKGENLECNYRRNIHFRHLGTKEEKPEADWSFHVYHKALFGDEPLLLMRKRLHQNDERAVPWVSLAVPLTPETVLFDGTENPPNWRVFLPLSEPGPSGCVFSAGLFVGPSRKSIEYRTEGKDEAIRKTQWNKLLVEKALVPLLADASIDILEHARDLVELMPKDYLSLFPRKRTEVGDPRYLTEHFQDCFNRGSWVLRVPDLWDKPIDILLGPQEHDGTNRIALETIPEWMAQYKACFQDLSKDKRRFVSLALGREIRARISGEDGPVIVEHDQPDVARSVLLADKAPDPADLKPLIERLLQDDEILAPLSLDGLWCLQSADKDGDLLRLDAETFYLSTTGEAQDKSLAILDGMGLEFEGTQRVLSDIGLPALDEAKRRGVVNLRAAGELSALEMLRHTSPRCGHDRFKYSREVAPLLDFLCQTKAGLLPPDLRLPFLVTIMQQQQHKRGTGLIALKPLQSSPEDEDAWDVFFSAAFPQMDRSFAAGVNRLIAHCPNMLNCLGDSACEVRILRSEDALSLLLPAQLSDPGVSSRIQKEIEHRLVATAKGQPTMEHVVERAVAALFAQADRSWDKLDDAKRRAFMALPIHRFSDGHYAPLLPRPEDENNVSAGYRLQSEEDLRDAPIQLSRASLLNVRDPTIKRFYRNRLNIAEHDRTSVLKQVMKEVGMRNEADTNRRLLEYLAKHFHERVEHLGRSSQDYDQSDAIELRQMMLSAKTVLCLDGEWRQPEGCLDGRDLASELTKQGWTVGRPVETLIARLLPGKHIVTTHHEIASAVQTLHDLPRCAPQMLAALALRSDCPELPLKDRLKILADNWSNKPDSADVSPVIVQMEIPCTSGDSPVNAAESVPPDVEERYPLVCTLFAKNRVLHKKFAEQFGIQPNRVREVLRLLGVPSVRPEDLDKRLTEGFGDAWSALNDQDRIQLLRHIRERKLAESLLPAARSTKVIRVGGKSASWVAPVNVVAPKLLPTSPPLLDPNQIPDRSADGIDTVWDFWCGISDLAALAEAICLKAGQLPVAQRQASAKQINDWIRRVIKDDPRSVGRLREILSSLPWVLAKCGGEREFKQPVDVLVHKAGALFGHGFWVPDPPIPEDMLKEPRLWGFPTAPLPKIESLHKIAKCLGHSTEVEEEVAISAYDAVCQCIGDRQDLYEEWANIAADVPLFRLFRKPDKVVTSRRLFMGNKSGAKDIGEELFCLAAQQDIPKVIYKKYGELGVNEGPSVEQLLFALSGLAHETNRVRQTHGQLLRAMKNLEPIGDGDLDAEQLSGCRVRTCQGTYRALGECYWDEELGHPGCFASESDQHIVDASDDASRDFCRWVDSRSLGVVRHLRMLATPELTGPIPEHGWTPELSQVLGPWRDWLFELGRPEACLRQDVEGRGLCPPVGEVHLVAVDRIALRYVVDAETAFVLSNTSDGSVASHLGGDTILIRRKSAEESYSNAQSLKEFDSRIAEQLAHLLCAEEHPTKEELDLVAILVRETLERPSVALERIRETQRGHFLHQYHDQEADPDYAVMFEEYQRTKEGTAKYIDLEKRMWQILKDKYVDARRKQIRGHGYDEFSVFSELLQNAEDAYAQRHQLGMPQLESRPAKFTYVSEEGKTTLLFEHSGRSFNYWRHGALEVKEFSWDVEGVLRSQGSFKAHDRQADTSKKPVGRFGLGFKSVYLLTDAPRIHSGSWHFEIEAGCLPMEIAPPADLSVGATRIAVPLRSEARTVEDPKGERLAGLIPFLREIDSLELRTVGHDRVLHLKTSPSLVCEGKNGTVERVTISGASYLQGGIVEVLRVRHQDHAAQLGLYLGEDGLPSPWDEAFAPDLYAALPLKTRLGVGVGLSHLFEIQSGRTHLVDPTGNEPRFEEAAKLVHALPEALETLYKQNTPSEVLARFWGLWQWTVGDEEAVAVRKAVAKEVANLPLAYPVAPTVGGGAPIKFGKMPIVYFSRIPDQIQEIFIDAKAPLLVDERGAALPLSKSQVVMETFALAYIRASKCAGIEPSGVLARLDWEAVGKLLRQTGALAKKPELLNQIADALEDEKQESPVIPWLAECPVAVGEGSVRATSAIPGELLPCSFPGSEHLPKRLLRTVSLEYSDKAQALLRKAGLRPCPSGQDLRGWIQGCELSPEEAAGILRFLAEDDRFMNKPYRDLKQVLQMPWFPHASLHITAAAAAERVLAEDARFWSDEFKAWLGAKAFAEVMLPHEPMVRKVDPAKVLTTLFRWWEKEGPGVLVEYEKRIYPLGAPPKLRPQFSARERLDRKHWLTLLILGALHTMGRTTPEQHRGFLNQCEHKGWMTVFSDPEIQADRWMGVLEKYLDNQVDQSLYYYWMQQFIRIFQLARWLPEYVELFLALDRAPPQFPLSQFTDSRASELFRGGGVDAPPLSRTLGHGACFVIRELFRAKVLSKPNAHRYCYVPSKQVRNLLTSVADTDLFEGFGDKAERSPVIHDFLAKHLGKDQATFGGAFDIPLQIVASDPILQEKFLGEMLPGVDDEESD